MFYSKNTGGFYDAAIHSDIPKDAVEISDEDHAALLESQSFGKLIQADANGYPVAIDRPSLSENDAVKAEIVALESSITDRRLREAILGVDEGWLVTINQKISALRDQLV